MFPIKLTALTCAFYFAITIVIYAAAWGWILLGQGGIHVSLRRAPFMAVFALVWLISFTLAWRILYAHVAAKFPN
jgi:hypothetical protein